MGWLDWMLLAAVALAIVPALCSLKKHRGGCSTGCTGCCADCAGCTEGTKKTLQKTLDK